MSLSLDSNSLTGVVPSEVAHLTALQYASISLNALTGVASEVFTMSSVVDLIAAGNAIRMPVPDLSKMTNLVFFDFGDNMLTNV